MGRLPLALALIVAAPAIAAAQAEGPQPCNQVVEGADYGPLRVGSIVVPQRHRFVGGDPNWDDRMARFLGRPARVTRLSGVDDQGCPGVRVDVDGGRWFWRVRDVNVGAGPPVGRRHRRAPAPLPQQCGRDEGTLDYGPIRVGSVVVLGRHRPVGDDPAWSEQMTPYVGRAARVVELAGVDDQGCAVVQVDADGRQHRWRIRDLAVAEDGGGSYRPGLASDHGRPSPGSRRPAVDARIPQACGQSDDAVDYGPLEEGAEVELGRHRPVDGVTNWAIEMEQLVGGVARVTERVGVDEQGCPLVRVDIDEGEWLWRIRDLRLRAPAFSLP